MTPGASSLLVHTLRGTVWYTYGMSEEGNEEAKRGRGRPRTLLGTAPKRNIRVHDLIWGQCEVRAEQLGISMSEYTRRALIQTLEGERWKALTSQVGRER